MFLIPEEYWQVKKTEDRGYGVYSKQIIKKGTVIGDYLGKVVKISEYDLDQDKAGLYLMYLDDRAAVYPDLKKPGIHLFNHSCSPNCWITNHNGHVLFFALRDINPGEELTISYLLAPKDKTCNPCTHECRCGNLNCSGSMHLSKTRFNWWQKYQKEHVKSFNLKYKFNVNLKKLSEYPSSIVIDSKLFSFSNTKIK